MTYSTLVEQIQSYLNRRDAETIAQIPNFIYMAEQRLCRDMKNIGIENYVVSTFTPGLYTYQKPANWQRTLNINYGAGDSFTDKTNLKIVVVEFANMYWPNPSLTGPPKYYADYGFGNYLVVPTPDLAYPFEMSYMMFPPPLNDNNQTNWFTNYAGDILFAASMYEAIYFVNDYEIAETWNTKCKSLIESSNVQDTQRKDDRYVTREAD